MKSNKVEEYSSNALDEIIDSISEKEEKRINLKMLLAARIENAMKAKGWNKKRLLKELGKKNASIATKWFSGTHNFTFDTLFELQEVLGVKLLNIEDSKDEVVFKYHLQVKAKSTTPCQKTWDSLIKSVEGDTIHPIQIQSFPKTIIAEA